MPLFRYIKDDGVSLKGGHELICARPVGQVLPTGMGYREYPDGTIKAQLWVNGLGSHDEVLVDLPPEFQQLLRDLIAIQR